MRVWAGDIWDRFQKSFIVVPTILLLAYSMWHHSGMYKKIAAENHARERALLESGLTYVEVAERLGDTAQSVGQRNRYKHHVDLQHAFRARIERDGIPNRLEVSDAFGYWLAGFFDGEGCLGFWLRERGPRREPCLSVQIAVREDDTSVLEMIQAALGGTLSRVKGHGTTRPAARWHIENTKDLAEKMIPLFERFPLQTKKRKEFELWAPFVRERYIVSLGGTTRTFGLPAEALERFARAVTTVSRREAA